MLLYSSELNTHSLTAMAVIPALASLNYNTLMPEIEIISFLNRIKDMFCIMYEIDELKKEVRIRFKKNVFYAENLDDMKMVELSGWIHKEERTAKGFTLRYKTQGNELDTHKDFPEYINLKATLPTPTLEGEIILSAFARYYITIKNDADILEWKEVGRLREVVAGEGENVMELSVGVPPQTTYLCNGVEFECPAVLGITKNPAVPSFAGYGVNILNKPAFTSVYFWPYRYITDENHLRQSAFPILHSTNIRVRGE